MIELTLKNLETNKTFTLKYTSVSSAKNMIIKCNHSSKIKVMEIWSSINEDREYLMRWAKC